MPTQHTLWSQLQSQAKFFETVPPGRADQHLGDALRRDYKLEGVVNKLFNGLLSALCGPVMIEVIVMISPFAFYWYSLYAPALLELHRWRATAWLEVFFLPHSVIPTSPFLEFLRWQIGTYAFSIGVLAFVFFGIQVYATKLLRKRVAQSGLYGRIRHPFYLGVAVAPSGF